MLVMVCTANALAQGKSVVTGGWSSVSGSLDTIDPGASVKATASVIKFGDGRVSGSVRWIYPEGSPLTVFELVVDEAEFNGDGTAVYLGGRVYSDGVPGARGVLKLIDNGEGENAPGPDRESYVVISAQTNWSINLAAARFYLDTPTVFQVNDWFEAVRGNIQIHVR
jgi:hypothetical protein